MDHLRLLTAKVGHTRHAPHKNAFSYDVFYIAREMTGPPLATPFLFSDGTWNIMSFASKDHGRRDASDPLDWLKELFEGQEATLPEDAQIVLIAHPRLFGYAFNPISYWLVFSGITLTAVACEVHNTFGDDHTYLLLHDDGRAIMPNDIFHAEKHLYVSPFNTMGGRYEFRFTYDESKFASHIEYFEEGEKILSTYMGGTFTPLRTRSILRALSQYPLMTLLVVLRIHSQAVRLWWKGVVPTLKERPKPTRGGTTRASKN